MKTIILVTVTFFSFQLLSQQELVINGSFEQGEQGWDFTASTDAYADTGLCVASNGESYLWFGDYLELTGLDSIADFVFQDVHLPANLNHAEFSFYWSGGSDEQDNVIDYDWLYFGLLDANGNDIYADSISNADMDTSITAADCDPLWYLQGFTIPSQYAGQTISIYFAASTDDINPTLFRVDEVSILSFTSNGLNENTLSSFVLSPNPVDDQLIIKNLDGKELNFVITDISGKVLLSSIQGGSNKALDVSNFASGIYLVTDNSGVQRKFVKK